MDFKNFMLVKKRPTLIVSLPANDPKLCRAAFDGGADAVKVHINVSHRASGVHFGRLENEKDRFQEMLSLDSGPMGVVLGGSIADVGLDIADIGRLGFSFYSVYAHNIPVWTLPMDRSLMAACDSSYSLDEVSRFKDLGADILEASIIRADEYGSPLSMRDLVAYSSLVEVSGLPVVVPTQRKIRPDEVSALAGTGIRGLMIGAIVTGTTEDSIRSSTLEFRRAVEKTRI